MILSIVILAFNGCAIKYTENVKHTDKLKDNKFKKAFLQYWTYMFHKKYDKAYKMELPYFRFLYSKKDYISKENLSNYKKLIINSIKKKGNIYEVDMVQEGNPVLIQDKWLYMDGKYYHVQDDFLLYPKMR